MSPCAVAQFTGMVFACCSCLASCLYWLAQPMRPRVRPAAAMTIMHFMYVSPDKPSDGVVITRYNQKTPELLHAALFGESLTSGTTKNLVVGVGCDHEE